MKFFVSLIFVFLQITYAGVVSTSPAITEIVKFLGAENSLIGVSNYCQTTKKIQKIGSAFQMNYEKIIALKPSIVLLNSTKNAGVEESLKKLKVNYLTLNLNTLEDIKDSFNKINRALELSKREKISHFFKPIKKIETKKKKRVLLVIFEKDKSGRVVEVRSAGKNSYYEDLIELLGHENALKDSSVPYPVLDYERLHKLDYDIVIRIGPHAKNRGHLEKIWNKTFPNKIISFVLGDYAVVPGPGIERLYYSFKEILND